MRILVAALGVGLLATPAGAFMVVDANNEFADRKALSAAAPFANFAKTPYGLFDAVAPTSQWTARKKKRDLSGPLSRSGYEFSDGLEDAKPALSPAPAQN